MTDSHRRYVVFIDDSKYYVHHAKEHEDTFTLITSESIYNASVMTKDNAVIIAKLVLDETIPYNVKVVKLKFKSTTVLELDTEITQGITKLC